jgi:hypothetical protein
MLKGAYIMAGNKQNNYLNRLWATHAKKFGKKLTSKMRRRHGRNIISEQQDSQGKRFRERGR